MRMSGAKRMSQRVALVAAGLMLSACGGVALGQGTSSTTVVESTMVDEVAGGLLHG